MVLRFRATHVALAAVLAAGAVEGAGDLRLVEAVKNQEHARATALLAQRADVKAVDAEGMSALHWAAHWNDLAVARAVLRGGADVNLASRYGVTPLLEAAVVGDTAMIRALLGAGARPSVATPEGETPLMRAARTGNVDAVGALLAAGADVKATEHFRGATALMYAVAENHAAVARLLLARGADVNSRALAFDHEHQPTRRGSISYFYLNGGLTPLMLAARQGALEAGRVLVEAGADVRAEDPDLKMTPMLIAVYNGQYTFASMLAERGADLNDGSLYLAVEMRSLNGASKRSLPDADGTLPLLKTLLAKGANPNQELTRRLPPRENGNPVVAPKQSPLIRAARVLDRGAMEVLLDGGADPNAGAAADGTTPLLALLGGGGGGGRGGGGVAPFPTTDDDTIAAMRLLLEHRANINASNAAGDTVLHAAAQRGRDALIQFLADNGATLDIKNKQGFTALDLAGGAGAGGAAAGRGGGRGAAAAPAQPRPTTVALLRKLAALPSP